MQSHSHGGFTLVEVLVALFLVALGIVGAGAAQLAAQRTRQHAALVSEAAQLGASLAARMQANAALSASPMGANPYLALEYDALADGAPAGSVSCFAASACDPMALAAFDLHEARMAMFTRFPAGRIAICRDRTPWDAAQRRYRWTCSGDAQAPVAIKIGWHGAASGPAFVSMVAR